MREEMVATLERLAEERGFSPTLRLVFLVNNYDNVLSVFAERRVGDEEARASNLSLSSRLVVFLKEPSLEKARVSLRCERVSRHTAVTTRLSRRSLVFLSVFEKRVSSLGFSQREFFFGT